MRSREDVPVYSYSICRKFQIRQTDSQQEAADGGPSTTEGCSRPRAGGGEVGRSPAACIAERFRRLLCMCSLLTGKAPEMNLRQAEYGEKTNKNHCLNHLFLFIQAFLGAFRLISTRFLAIEVTAKLRDCLGFLRKWGPLCSRPAF